MLETDLKKKLWAIVAIELVLVMAVGVIGLAAISSEIVTERSFVMNDIAFQDVASQIMIDVLQQRRYEKGYLLSFGEPEWQQEYMKDFQERAADFDRRVGILESLAVADPHLAAADKAMIADLGRVHQEYVREFLAVVDRTKTDPGMTPQAADDLMEENRKGLPDLERNVRTIMDAGSHMQDMVARQSIASGEHARILIVATILGALILAALLGTWLARSIYLAFLRARLHDLSDAP